MGQTAHPGRAPVRARWSALWAGAATLGSVLVVSGCSTPVAEATTSLAGVRDATVVHANGDSVRAVPGLRLRRGDIVRTAADGRAELVTRTRIVYEGSDASVQVVDGAHQQLRQGAAVADAQHGPGLDLTVAGMDVTVPRGSAVRAERGVTVRIGALAGPGVRVVSDNGRELSVPALYQALVGGDALPDVPSPLWLTDDDAEAHVVPALVRDDESLRALAAGIDGTTRSTARVVTAAWHGPVVALPPGLARSEKVMPILLAVAGGRTNAGDRYRQAVQLRAQGGSWGVVAHLLHVPVPAAVAALAAFERTQPGGLVGSVPAVFAALGVGGGVGGGGTSGPGGTPGHHGRHGSGQRSGGTPTPQPSASGGPVAGLVNSLSATVAQLLSVVPTLVALPSASPTSVLPRATTSPSPLLPLPSPTPTPVLPSP